MSTEILDAVSRAVWVAGCCDDATYDEAVAAAKRGSPADASALLFNQEVAKAAISAMQSEISADRDAAVARAEQAEARVAELEAEVEMDKCQAFSVGYEAGEKATAGGEELEKLRSERDAMKAEVERLRGQFAAGWKAAIEAAADFIESAPHEWRRSVDARAISSIPMPSDAAAALDRLTAQARAQGMREASEIAAHRYAVCEDAFSKGLGAEERHCALEAKYIEDKIRSHAEEIGKEARNG